VGHVKTLAIKTSTFFNPEEKMADTLSKFDKAVEDAFQTAADRIEEYLVRQGVDRTRAVAFIERDLTFLRMPGLDLKISVQCGDIRTRGSSDNCLIWFARELHCHHQAELGGQPQFIGNEQPPEYDHVAEEKARVQAEMKRRSDAEYEALIESQRKQAEAFRKRAAEAAQV
jgi:hypothetical protein